MNRQIRRHNWLAKHRQTNATRQTRPRALDHTGPSVDARQVWRLNIESVELVDMSPVSHAQLSRLLSEQLSSVIAAMRLSPELQGMHIRRYAATNSSLTAQSSVQHLAQAITSAVQSSLVDSLGIVQRHQP